MAAPYQLITTEREFNAVCESLQSKTIIGVDLEGEWNLHRYGLHLCLIQISDGEQIWLVDPYAIKDLNPFISLMENEQVMKVSHGPQSDIILLNYRFGAEPKNIFDTEKAGQLLAYSSTSLSGLLELKFGISKNIKIRELDWINRPLTEEMLNYAAMDVEYLIPLHSMLTADLSARGRLSWQEEENKVLETVRYRKKENPHLEIKGANKLSLQQMLALKAVYEVRDEIARESDKPAYHIISNDKLVALAVNPPLSKEDWENLKGVNPRVKLYAEKFAAALEASRTEWKKLRAEGVDEFKYLPRRRLSQAQVRWGERITESLEKVREVIAREVDIFPMVLSSRTIKRIAMTEISWADLRNWQREIIEETAARIGVDISLLRQEVS